MSINYGQLRNVTAREIISALNRDGFVFDRGDGSHQIYYHPADGRRVTVIFHAGSSTFRRKTLKSMIEQSCWTEDDLVRLKLLKK